MRTSWHLSSTITVDWNIAQSWDQLAAGQHGQPRRQLACLLALHLLYPKRMHMPVLLRDIPFQNRPILDSNARQVSLVWKASIASNSKAVILNPVTGPSKEIEMHSLNVSFKLKNKSAVEFARIFEGEIIPLLRRQKGFEDEINFVAPERAEAVGISLWDKKEDAATYYEKRFPEVLKALSRVIEGAPRVETFEVSNSTYHQIAASAIS
jgi:hypothetical protein